MKNIDNLNDFGRAPIKMEGGIANPDEFTFECNCQDCKDRYKEWKEQYIAQQEELRNRFKEN